MASLTLACAMRGDRDSNRYLPITGGKTLPLAPGPPFVLTIEQFIKILLPSMSDLILLHQELLHLILYALDLVEVPCLPIASPSHPINIILSFLYIS